MSIIVYRRDCSMRSFEKTTRHVCIFYYSSEKIVLHPFPKQVSAWKVHPLDSLLGLRPWTPLGDFRPSGYLPLCVNPSPKLPSRWRHWQARSQNTVPRGGQTTHGDRGGGRQIILVLRCTGAAVSCGGTDHSWGQVAWRGSVVRASVFDWRTFPDMRLIYGWRVTTSRVRRPLRVNQPGQLNLLPSVGRGMSSISIVRWVSLLAAVSPSSEC